jgi:thioredoxin reductase (NADPH)
MKYDLIIAGMGIAGLSAAIYAKNSGLNVLIIEKETPGGLLNKISEITNYPGFTKITGPDFAYQLFDMINKMEIPYKIDEIKDVEIINNTKKIITTNENYETNYLILATGRTNRPLGLDKEEKLLGHGISTCAICDASLYKDKTIAVVGGGNSALLSTLYLSNYAKKIYLIHRRCEFRADAYLIDKLSKKDNIEYLFNSNITKLNEKNNQLESIEINNEQTLNISGLFTFIGFIPNVNFLKKLNITDEEGYIKVNEKYETNIEGIYAVGDCIKKDVYQLVTAASEGAIAALEVYKRINQKH